MDIIQKISLLFTGKNLNETVSSLQYSLGENLVSLIQYGSSIRGDKTDQSDINLLIILKVSTPEAHGAISDILINKPYIRPFILGSRGFERSVKSFAVKFLSIRRNHKLLYGEDLVANLAIDNALERFLTEQGIRNMRLRLVKCFVTQGPSKNYQLYLYSLVTPLFTDIAEVLRCEQEKVPHEFLDRIPVFQTKFQISFSFLQSLLVNKKQNVRLSRSDLINLHHQIYILLDHITLYIEQHWNE